MSRILNRLYALLRQPDHFKGSYDWTLQDLEVDGFRMVRYHRQIDDHRLMVHRIVGTGADPYWHLHGKPIAVVVTPDRDSTYRLHTGAEPGVPLSTVEVRGGQLLGYAHEAPTSMHAVEVIGASTSICLMQLDAPARDWLAPEPPFHADHYIHTIRQIWRKLHGGPEE